MISSAQPSGYTPGEFPRPALRGERAPDCELSAWTRWTPPTAKVKLGGRWRARGEGLAGWPTVRPPAGADRQSFVSPPGKDFISQGAPASGERPAGAALAHGLDPEWSGARWRSAACASSGPTICVQGRSLCGILASWGWRARLPGPVCRMMVWDSMYPQTAEEAGGGPGGHLSQGSSGGGAPPGSGSRPCCGR